MRLSPVPHTSGPEGGFRWRAGESVTRLEGFSDAVFGFAVTLLVLSLDVPRTSHELLALFRGIPAFAASFAVLILIWHRHCLFFRRYALQDAVTTTINAVLLFLVACYVYPLKFLFTLVTDLLLDGRTPDIAPEHGTTVMAMYAVGMVAVFGLLALLYARAWRLRAAIGLDAREQHMTVTSVQHLSIYCGVGTLAMVITGLGGPAALPWAGLSFVLLGPLCGMHGWWRGRSLPPASLPINTGRSHP